MIKIFQNDNVINNEIKNNSIIFSSAKDLLKLKKVFIDKDVLITTLDNYAGKLVNDKYNKKLVDDVKSFIYMFEAFENVKEKITKYSDISDVSFSKILINTYTFYKENKLNENDKTKSLRIIFNEYERLLDENNLITKYKMYELFLDCIYDIGYQNIYFENLSELKSYEIDFINKLKINKNVYIYANTINNLSFISDLNKIDEVNYELSSNSDVNLLFKLGTNNLFKNTSIVSCNDLYEEIRYVSRKIKEDINNGLHFKDILVVSSDINRYDNYFKLLFDFPYFKKEKHGVLTKNFIDIFFKIIKGDFRCSLFISLLKLNILKLDEKAINDLDNYVYMWDLEDKPFYEEFKFNPSGKKDFSEYDYGLLKYLNEARISIINPIRYLLSNIVKERSVTEILKYLFTYMDEEEINLSLFSKDKEGYDKFVELLEIVNDTDQSINITNLLDIISNCYDVSYKEVKNKDEVDISSLKDYTFNFYKKVYFIGFTEKDLPSKFSFSTLINKNDLEDCDVFNLMKAHSDKEKNLISNVLLNKNVVITYHKLDDSSFKVERSSILDKFASDVISYKYDVNKKDETNFDLKIDSLTAQKLYGNDLILSPSSLEVFAKCKYSYFLSYGLRLNIKEKMTFDNREVGTFIHFILENCIKDNVSYENVEELVNKYTDKYFSLNLRDYSNTLNYVVNELKVSTVILIKTILDELEQTKFKPKYTEAKIKDLPFIIKLDKGTIKISGIVDRIDVYEDDNNFYYRIIDYKTGTKKFRLDDVLNGLNMQMLIYLIAIKNSNITNKNIIPTGFLYYPALLHYKKEMVGIASDAVIENLKSSLKMNGIINKDYLSLYNEDEIGKYIDVTTKGNINYEKVLNADELNLVFKKVIDVLKQEANSMLSGDIKVNPINDTKNDSCKYCKFSSICKFDIEKNKPRRFKSLNKSEVLNSIEGDINGMDA